MNGQSPPADSVVTDAVTRHTERGCVDLLLPDEDVLISLQAEDLYITVYHPTEEILSLLRQAVSKQGFYIWQTPQIKRIKKYESYLNEAQQLLHTGENPDRLKYLIGELEAYYESVKWRKDFENDEAGLLPKNLKRGVLSEDGINDLLDEYKEVSEGHFTSTAVFARNRGRTGWHGLFCKSSAEISRS
ncbi:MAG: DUF4298 domain-containing protein [Ruminococcus sp.]|nr:DUF4298 domain-containing protein [Ruminococcus sp.]